MSLALRASRRLDPVLLFLVCSIGGIGIVNLSSAALLVQVPYHILQAAALGVGVVGAIAIGLAADRIVRQGSHLFFGFVVALLLLVALAGTELNGSRRWLDLGAFMLQPSELLKLAAILVTARFFGDRETPEQGYSARGLAPLAAAVLGGTSLVLIQPDLGTSLVIFAIVASMALFEGVRRATVLLACVALIASLPLAWGLVLKEYQKDRVISFLDPGADERGESWQVRQSIIAFGSGGVWGKGHGQGTQIQQGFVPEHENDFAATTWAEERGFIGMILLLALYFALILWSLRIASRASDRFGVHLGVGMAAFFFWHVLINLGMVTGMLPVVGLPLPLMSYGRSNLMTTMIGVGLLLHASGNARDKRA